MLLINCSPAKKHSLDSIYEQFRNPPAEDLPVVYWFWNGDMNPDTIRQQLVRMKKSGTVSGAVIMAWEGLSIDYLSDEWFDRVKFACGEAKKNGLKIWLYDEIRWPSGHAGGHVLRENPNLRARCLAQEIHKISGSKNVAIDLPEKTVAVVVSRRENGRVKITSWGDWSKEKNGAQFRWQAQDGDWRVHVFYEEQCQFKPSFLEGGYVDLLNPQVAEKFIELTHERYFQEMPEYFGSVVEAIITDEPGLYCNLKPFMINPGAVPFTPDLFDKFYEKKNYDLRRYLPALWENIGDETAAVRADFYDFLAKQFGESYLQPLQNWCAEHDIQLNVQPVHEETMKYDAFLQGDYFQVMQYSDLQGCDEVYHWDKSNLTPKLASSAAHLMGKKYVYCEVFGAYGWDLSLSKMKAISDWLFVRGVNRLQLSGFYFSDDNSNWRMEVPPSLFYQNTQWKYLKYFTDYVQRLSTILSQITPDPQIALYRPNLSLRALLSVIDEAEADSLDRKFNELANHLFDSQLDFNFVDDQTLISRAKIVSRTGKCPLLRVTAGKGKMDFKIVLVPFAMVMYEGAFAKIQEFENQGGKVFWFGDSVNFLLKNKNSSPRGRVRVLSEPLVGKNYFQDKKNLVKKIKEKIITDVFVRPENSAINVLHGTVAGAEVYFVCHRDSSFWQGTVSLRAVGVPEFWNAENGTRNIAKNFQTENGRINVALNLAPFGSALIVLLPVDSNPNQTTTPIAARKIEIGKQWKFSPMDGSFPEEIRTIGSWTERQVFDKQKAKAHPHFSGTGVYRQSLDLPDSLFATGKKLVLKINDVRDIAEVWCNGALVGVRCWQPFEFDVTRFVRKGKNEMEIRVTNTPANRYMLVPQNYLFGEKWGKVMASGLVGEVSLVIKF
ncbi:hypothetical protein B6D60_08470 [candidate division KSB1 bacterium 4484_87]|nr:MAG: hypothetical protein B6D60_08470 [candidate division KSB1 bacterium 4484_87]